MGFVLAWKPKMVVRLLKDADKKVEKDWVLDNSLINFSFSRESRLRTPSHFQQVFDHGKRFFSPYFTLYCYSNEKGVSRLGVICSKKCEKRAVHRNWIRRLVKEQFRCSRKDLKSMDIVVIVRQNALKEQHQELRVCLEKLFRQCKKLLCTSASSASKDIG